MGIYWTNGIFQFATSWNILQRINMYERFLFIYFLRCLADEAFIADVAKKAALEENIVRLVIQSISIHVEDRGVVLKIVSIIFASVDL